MLGYRFGGERPKVTGEEYRGLRRALLEKRGDVLSVALDITHVKVSLRARADQRPAEQIAHEHKLARHDHQRAFGMTRDRDGRRLDTSQLEERHRRIDPDVGLRGREGRVLIG